MIRMINWIKLKNLEEELDKKELEILHSSFKRIDLQELEEIANKIMALRLEMSGVKLNLE